MLTLNPPESVRKLQHSLLPMQTPGTGSAVGGSVSLPVTGDAARRRQSGGFCRSCTEHVVTLNKPYSCDQTTHCGRCNGLEPATLRQAARLCPVLETLRVGGTAAASAAAAAALPDVVPLVRVPAGNTAGESWEELPDPDSSLSKVCTRRGGLSWQGSLTLERLYIAVCCATSVLFIAC